MTKNEKANIEKANIERALAEENRIAERQSLLRRLWQIGKLLEADVNSLDRLSAPVCGGTMAQGLSGTES